MTHIIDGMETDHIGAQQSFDDAARPFARQHPEYLIGRKRDMQKEPD